MTRRLKVLDSLRWAIVSGILLATAVGAVAGSWDVDRLARCALMALLAALAAFDLRHRRVPNEVTLSLLTLAALSVPIRLWDRALDGSAVLVVGVAWLACLALWGLRVIGGGDAKLLMGLLALTPDVELVQALLGATLIGSLLTLTFEDGGLWRLVRVPIALYRRAICDTYQQRGHPLVVWLAAGTAFYLLPRLFI